MLSNLFAEQGFKNRVYRSSAVQLCPVAGPQVEGVVCGAVAGLLLL